MAKSRKKDLEYKVKLRKANDRRIRGTLQVAEPAAAEAAAAEEAEADDVLEVEETSDARLTMDSPHQDTDTGVITEVMVTKLLRARI